MDETPVFEIVLKDGTVIHQGAVTVRDDGFDVPIPDHVMQILADGREFDIRFVPAVILPMNKNGE